MAVYARDPVFRIRVQFEAGGARQRGGEVYAGVFGFRDQDQLPGGGYLFVGVGVVVFEAPEGFVEGDDLVGRHRVVHVGVELSAGALGEGAVVADLDGYGLFVEQAVVGLGRAEVVGPILVVERLVDLAVPRRVVGVSCGEAADDVGRGYGARRFPPRFIRLVVGVPRVDHIVGSVAAGRVVEE